jgi:hypothetical protein
LMCKGMGDHPDILKSNEKIKTLDIHTYR